MLQKFIHSIEIYTYVLSNINHCYGSNKTLKYILKVSCSVSFIWLFLGDDESNSNDISTVVSDGDVQLSTLPSPDNSVVSDLDSNMGSISTDTLVKSHPQYNNFKQPQGI